MFYNYNEKWQQYWVVQNYEKVKRPVTIINKYDDDNIWCKSLKMCNEIVQIILNNNILPNNWI